MTKVIKCPSSETYPPTASPEQLVAAKKNLDRARLSILKSKTLCAFSGVVSCGKEVLSTTYETAETDGWNSFYNPHLVNEFAKLDRNLVVFVVLHEAVHKAYEHCSTKFMWAKLWYPGKPLGEMNEKEVQDHLHRQQLYARAIDIFVNTLIDQMDPRGEETSIPDWAIQPQEWARGLSVGSIFKKLQNEQSQCSGGKPMDNHVLGGEPTGEDERVKRERKVKRELQSSRFMQISKNRGNGIGDQAGGTDALLEAFTPPQIRWTEVLSNLLAETEVAGHDYSSWSRVNRRHLATGTYMPGGVSVAPGTLLLFGDTSGSCFSDCQLFVSEMIGICEQIRPARVIFVWVDAVIQGVQIFENGDYERLRQDLKPTGGGGTDMRIVFDLIKEKRWHVDGIVGLSDGETPWPSEQQVNGVPLFWVITEHHIKAPVGVTLHFN